VKALRSDSTAGRLVRAFKLLPGQLAANREYLYFWVIATIVDIALLNALQPWAWIALAVVNLIFGVAALASVVGPVDKAFESIGLDFNTGYGTPQWLVEGKYPLTQDILRIKAAGYTPADFEKYLGQISSRLNLPIREIRKPSVKDPVLEVLIKRTQLPSHLEYSKLPLGDLKQGEFFLGQTEDGYERLSLSKMIHMLVAGQTGSGKTQFLRQCLATLLTQSRESHVCLIDMKGGIDFQSFQDAPNFELVTSYEEADLLLDRVIDLFETRKNLILAKRKDGWSAFSMKELENEPSLAGKPIGPVVVMVDELAELSKKATAKSAKGELQEKIATLARLSRFTGIHLILGTQRPDKSTIDMQSKDNLPTRVCFSVPSVTASTLVIGDMTASTLGSTPGRAVFQLGSNKIIQTPLITNSELEAKITRHTERLTQLRYRRSIFRARHNTQPNREEVRIK
jgi:hypothetical protein